MVRRAKMYGTGIRIKRRRTFRQWLADYIPVMLIVGIVVALYTLVVVEIIIRVVPLTVP